MRVRFRFQDNAIKRARKVESVFTRCRHRRPCRPSLSLPSGRNLGQLRGRRHHYAHIITWSQE